MMEAERPAPAGISYSASGASASRILHQQQQHQQPQQQQQQHPSRQYHSREHHHVPHTAPTAISPRKQGRIRGVGSGELPPQQQPPQTSPRKTSLPSPQLSISKSNSASSLAKPTSTKQISRNNSSGGPGGNSTANQEVATSRSGSARKTLQQQNQHQPQHSELITEGKPRQPQHSNAAARGAGAAGAGGESHMQSNTGSSEDTSHTEETPPAVDPMGPPGFSKLKDAAAGPTTPQNGSAKKKKKKSPASPASRPKGGSGSNAPVSYIGALDWDFVEEGELDTTREVISASMSNLKDVASDTLFGIKEWAIQSAASMSPRKSSHGPRVVVDPFDLYSTTENESTSIAFATPKNRSSSPPASSSSSKRSRSLEAMVESFANTIQLNPQKFKSTSLDPSGKGDDHAAAAAGAAGASAAAAEGGGNSDLTDSRAATVPNASRKILLDLFGPFLACSGTNGGANLNQPQSRSSSPGSRGQSRSSSNHAFVQDSTGGGSIGAGGATALAGSLQCDAGDALAPLNAGGTSSCPNSRAPSPTNSAGILNTLSWDTQLEDERMQIQRLTSWGTNGTYGTINTSLTADDSSRASDSASGDLTNASVLLMSGGQRAITPLSGGDGELEGGEPIYPNAGGVVAVDDDGNLIPQVLLEHSQRRREKRRRKRLVKFDYPPISSLRECPRPDPNDLPDLFFTEEELDEIEADRSSTISADDVEIVAVANDFHLNEPSAQPTSAASHPDEDGLPAPANAKRAGRRPTSPHPQRKGGKNNAAAAVAAAAAAAAAAEEWEQHLVAKQPAGSSKDGQGHVRMDVDPLAAPRTPQGNSSGGLSFGSYQSTPKMKKTPARLGTPGVASTPKIANNGVVAPEENDENAAGGNRDPFSATPPSREGSGSFQHPASCRGASTPSPTQLMVGYPLTRAPSPSFAVPVVSRAPSPGFLRPSTPNGSASPLPHHPHPHHHGSSAPQSPAGAGAGRNYTSAPSFASADPASMSPGGGGKGAGGATTCSQASTNTSSSTRMLKGVQIYLRERSTATHGKHRRNSSR